MVKIKTFNGMESGELLQLAASVENFSEHSLAKAIVNYALEKDVSFLKLKNFNSHTGLGVTAQVNGKNVSIGRFIFLQNKGINIIILCCLVF